jgi:hypothetical protein
MGVTSKGSPANGFNIDDGGTFDSPAHHLILRGLTVEDNGPRGNLDGIKLSGVEDFLVEDCTVRRWGSGGSAVDMVGCRRNTFAGNLVVWHAGEVSTHVNVGPNTEAASFTFAANLWYAADAPARSKPSLPAAERGGVYGRGLSTMPSPDGSWPARPAKMAAGATTDAEAKA